MSSRFGLNTALARIAGKGGRARREPTFGGQARESGDSLNWAKEYQTADERIALKKAVRRLTIGLCVSLGLNFLLVDTIRVMMPLKEVSPPKVLTVNSAYDVAVWVGDVPFGSERSKDIIEKLTIGYVRQRFEFLPDEKEMQKRWLGGCSKNNRDFYNDDLCSYVLLHSTSQVYNDFYEEITKTVDQWITNGLRRTIQINADPIWHAENHLEIRLTATDSQCPKRRSCTRSDEFAEIDRSEWIVNVWFEFNEPTTDPKRKIERYLNPENYVVTRWSAARVDTPTKAAAATPSGE